MGKKYQLLSALSGDDPELSELSTLDLVYLIQLSDLILLDYITLQMDRYFLFIFVCIWDWSREVKKATYM